ncbi:MAG TPA: dockerin type I domain-containing protein [Lacipirellulaceae bacterium]|jgi:hypothetical protein|nr:dockerin type I domain-containing protein [Lacipirellulaceae bacterium]
MTRTAEAAATLSPLASFGGGDGWLSPGENDYPYLTSDDKTRGLAYGNGHLYLVTRANPNLDNTMNVRILDPTIGVDGSGNDLGALNTTAPGIIAGGTFAVNMVGVGGDGAIYVGNLQTTTSTSGGAFYKVYKWANESATPTVAYSGNAGLDGARIGDDFAVTGSGASTRIVSGFSNAATAVPGTNGYSIIDPTAGTATAVAFAATPPAAGDFKYGVTFTDSTHVIGTQTGGSYQYSSYSGSTGTLIGTAALTGHAGGSTAERLMAYDVINGTPVLAMQSYGDSHVSIYNVADPAHPVFLADGNNTLGALVTNGNGVGSVTWGATVNNGDGSFSANLYAMSTNQGIQAFTFTLSASASVAGDYNHNGVVDAADYVLWRDTLNQSVAAGTGADGDGDGVVTQADYGFWRARFGNTSGSGSLASANVPEPTSLVGCCVAGGLISLVSRRRAAK